MQSDVIAVSTSHLCPYLLDNLIQHKITEPVFPVIREIKVVRVEGHGARVLLAERPNCACPAVHFRVEAAPVGVIQRHFPDGVALAGVNQYCALMGIVFSVAYWMLMRHKADALHKGLYSLLAVLLCAVSVMQTGDMVNNQTINEKYDQMTRGVLFEATDPEKALAQFGIEARYSVLTDTYSTQSYPVVLPESGALDEGFLDHYTTSDVTLYYLRHPIQLLGLFEVGVRNAFFTRTDYSGNYEQSSGMPARAKALFLSIWSTFKERSAPQTAASLLLLVVAFLFFRRKADEKLESGREAASVYTMLSVLLFAAVTVELMTVVILSGDSLLLRQSFLMGCLIDLLAIMACTE